jgi:hypothetical protein
MEYGLNKINIRLFTQEVGWLNGKWIEFKEQTSHVTFIVINIGILT